MFEQGDVTVDAVTYLGCYEMVAVTEFMIRPSTVAGIDADPSFTLRQSLSTEVASSSLSELDKLDAEMMLGVLGGQGSPSADPTAQPVLIATAKLFLDSE